MRENCTKVIPMILPEPTDPYMFDTSVQEFVEIKLNEQQFNSFVEMLENTSKHSSDVVDRFKRYQAMWEKGAKDES